MRKARAHAKRKGGRGSADEVQGWVQLSIELVPEFLAKQTPVGQGRSDPNDYPYLAPPVNRFQFSWNFCVTMKRLIGAKLCFRLGCFACCVVAFIATLVLLYFITPSLIANMIV